MTDTDGMSDSAEAAHAEEQFKRVTAAVDAAGLMYPISVTKDTLAEYIARAVIKVMEDG